MAQPTIGWVVVICNFEYVSPICVRKVRSCAQSVCMNRSVWPKLPLEYAGLVNVGIPIRRDTAFAKAFVASSSSVCIGVCVRPVSFLNDSSNRMSVSVVCFVSHSNAAQHPVRASVTTQTASCLLLSVRKPKSSCKQSRRSGCFVWYACRAFAATQVLHHARNGKCVNSCSSRSCWLGCRGTGRPRAGCVSRSCSGSSGIVSWTSSDAFRSSFPLENSVIPVHFRVSFSNSSSPLVQSSWCSIIDPSENCIMVLRQRTSVSGGPCSLGRCSALGR